MPDQFPCKEHEAKIAVLEVEVGHLQNDARETKQWLKSIDGKVDDIKERLDRQNGAIPHMSQDISKLSESVSTLHSAVSNLQVNSSKTETKTMIIWGILTAIGAAVLAAVTRFLIG